MGKNMARARVRLSALLFSVAFAGLTACMTDHAALEKMPNRDSGGGGAGGSLGFAGHAPVSGSGGASAGGGHADDEAPGTSVLTIVHGVVDAPSVVVCLATVTSDGSVAPFGKPLSAKPLRYGQSIVLPEVSGADPASDAIEAFLIAGELDLVAGLNCASAIERARAEEAQANSPLGAAGAPGASELGTGGSSADGGASGAGAAAGDTGAPAEVQSRLRVRGLPAIPAGTLNGGRSYLLVANGCLGGSGFSAANAEAFCGMGYSERLPTISATFVALSRASSVGHVGLQVVHASLATGTISVDSSGGVSSSSSPITIVTNEVQGGLAPRPAYIAHTAFDYGSARGYGVEVVAQNATLLTESWADVLEAAGLSDLQDGSNYALVLIGPRADLQAGPAFWNLPAITVVPADPK
jgi:hypothetical protein